METTSRSSPPSCDRQWMAHLKMVQQLNERREWNQNIWVHVHCGVCVNVYEYDKVKKSVLPLHYLLPFVWQLGDFVWNKEKNPLLVFWRFQLHWPKCIDLFCVPTDTMAFWSQWSARDSGNIYLVYRDSNYIYYAITCLTWPPSTILKTHHM